MITLKRAPQVPPTRLATVNGTGGWRCCRSEWATPPTGDGPTGDRPGEDRDSAGEPGHAAEPPLERGGDGPNDIGIEPGTPLPPAADADRVRARDCARDPERAPAAGRDPRTGEQPAAREEESDPRGRLPARAFVGAMRTAGALPAGPLGHDTAPTPRLRRCARLGRGSARESDAHDIPVKTPGAPARAADASPDTTYRAEPATETHRSPGAKVTAGNPSFHGASECPRPGPGFGRARRAHHRRDRREPAHRDRDRQPRPHPVADGPGQRRGGCRRRYLDRGRGRGLLGGEAVRARADADRERARATREEAEQRAAVRADRQRRDEQRRHRRPPTPAGRNATARPRESPQETRSGMAIHKAEAAERATPAPEKSIGVVHDEIPRTGRPFGRVRQVRPTAIGPGIGASSPARKGRATPGATTARETPRTTARLAGPNGGHRPPPYSTTPLDNRRTRRRRDRRNIRWTGPATRPPCPKGSVPCRPPTPSPL
ncbi:hypothetical protein EHYA_00729 [Embleya hyalina]|uniref:Uncharacterized protein n=1 Tax=Embleya hyalina TaxID=516124 RepID=A0A401YEN2_9ACTN|nr:hypothetical protein EHYA_00729 [Embleya hyalina]